MSSTIFVVDDPKGCNPRPSFDIVSKLWPDSDLSQNSFQENEYTSFIAYVHQEALRLQKHQSRFAAETMEGTISLIQRLRSNLNKRQNVVLADLRNLFSDVDEAAIARTLELMIRIWLTIDIRVADGGQMVVHKSDSALEWPMQVSLQETIRAQFTHSQPPNWYDKASTTQLDPSFTVSSLVDICCIELSWTNNLAKHLKLDKRRRILSIYEHKVCLLNHSRDSSSPIPHDALSEAIDTLNLLLPFGHSPTRELLRREKKIALYRLGICNRTRTLNMSDYPLWGPRLIELVELFNEPPKHWWQLLSDRRNLRDWATFWIGMLVLILTLVSIAFGTVSSIYTIKQYNLALAQACSLKESAQTLPEFCS